MAVAIEKPKRFKGRAKLHLRSLKRHGNGDWTVHAWAVVSATLPDGRRVVAERDILLRARQIGRRPNR